MTGVRRAAGAAVTLLALVVVAGCSTEAELEGSAWPDPTGAPEPAVSAAPAADLFSCDRTFTRASDPPADLVEQGGISEWAGGYLGDGYHVMRAASSPLGLVALVVGDEARARRELTARGVALVGRWDESESTRSVTPFAQVDALVERRMAPVLADVRAAVAGLDGEFEVRSWVPNGEVVVQWAAPVPPEVETLVGERPGRVRVAVEEVRYSRTDVEAALDAVDGAALDVDPTASYPCADGSGLVVAVAPDELGERRGELQDDLADVAGMPVLVVAQEATA